MRNWLVPATVLGLSGLALFCASERGRAQMHALLNRLASHGDPLGDFLDTQLAVIQNTLDDLARALEEQSA